MKEDYSVENTVIKIVEQIQKKMFMLDKVENDLIPLYGNSNSTMIAFYKKIEEMFDVKMDDKPKTLKEVINKIINAHKK